eukprot:TRINITY_DN380_c1_g1_i1.p1 TRINITY_DN380_c1_g1~~TRINITY_DN380_c1_g1_i1.p1  ORF type:complete len:478 (-),score=184.22 TRINITY_DN380_c1_g1_i1:46-1479(-)
MLLRLRSKRPFNLVRGLCRAYSDATVDKREIDNFSKLAADWWNPKGPMAGLLSMNTLRSDLLKKVVLARLRPNSSNDQPLTGLRCLDIGCGGGFMTESLARMGATVLGIDATAENIAVARRHLEEQEDRDLAKLIKYEHNTAETVLAEKGSVFDIVCAFEVVEHVKDAQFFTQTCVRLLKPSGLLFMSTVNKTWRALLLAIIGAEYVLRLLPRGTHQYSKFVSPRKLADWIERTHLSAVPTAKRSYSPSTSGFPSPTAESVLSFAKDLSQADNSVARAQLFLQYRDQENRGQRPKQTDQMFEDIRTRFSSSASSSSFSASSSSASSASSASSSFSPSAASSSSTASSATLSSSSSSSLSPLSESSSSSISTSSSTSTTTTTTISSSRSSSSSSSSAAAPEPRFSTAFQRALSLRALECPTRVLDFMGAGYNPFSNVWYLRRNHSVNYFLIAVKNVNPNLTPIKELQIESGLEDLELV